MVSQSSLKLVAASLQTGFSASVGVLSLLRGWNFDSIMSVRTDFYQVCLGCLIALITFIRFAH